MRKIDMVVIGTSAGGIDALYQILPQFKTHDLAVAVVIHLPPKGENLIPELLEPECKFKVQEAISGEVIQNQTIYIASPDYHLCLEPDHTLSLSTEEAVNYSRPSIDILFDSAAYAYRSSLLGILLTGANSDGALGLKKIQEQGGITIVQDPKNIDYPMMPQSAIDIMRPDYVMTIEDISKFIFNMSREGMA